MIPLSLTDSILKLQLSFKCHYQLRRNGIYTVGDLISFNRNRLNAISGLSERHIEEIYTVLDFLSFELDVPNLDIADCKLSKDNDANNDENGFSEAVKDADNNGTLVKPESISMNESIYQNTWENITHEVLSAENFNAIECNVEIENNEESTILLDKLEISLVDDNGQIEKVLPLEHIGLSNRSYNCLKGAGYSDAFQLINITEDELLSIRNLGQGSMIEIIGKIKEVKEGKYDEIINAMYASSLQGDTNSLSNDNEPESKYVLLFHNADGTSQNDIPIENLGLSLRSYNGLKKAGYDFASQLVNMTRYSLLSINNLGARSVTEILNIVQSLSFEKVELSVNDEIKQRILHCLKNNLQGVDKYKIYASIQETVEIELNAIDSLLCEMEIDKKISIEGDTIELRRMKIREYVQSLGDERAKSILLMCLEGKSLEEVGSLNGNITRERVRQLRNKSLDRRPSLHEDKYIDVFERYYFSEADFCDVFGESKDIYNYLIIVCKTKSSDKLNIKQLTTDESVSVDVRRAAEKIVYKDFISINGERVYKSSNDIVYYVLRTFFKDEASYDDFVDIYNRTIVELGLGHCEDFIINYRTYENKLSKSNRILWQYPKTLRYYDMDDYDYIGLLQEIELSQYDNVEISTQKIFNEHPKLMVMYDIRNGHELHNLLKKLHEKNEIQKNIVFGRMPIIEFGIAKPDNQVFEMLISLAPVSKQDLVLAYEQEYGVLQQTISANYLKCIEKYLDGEMYDISVPPLSKEQFSRMKSVLTEDYYEISEIARIYQREFPGENENNINPFTIKTLGFIIYNSYVIKSNYISVAEYCRDLLMKEDIVDSRTFPAGLTGKGSYSSVLMNLKDQYEIVEFEPFCYINIRRLNEYGITIEHLKGYCDTVTQHTEIGEYFTVSSLDNSGFSHHLDSLDFSTVFYSSLLSEDKRFTYQRMGGTKVFRKGSGETSLKGFLEYIVERETSIDIFDFMELLTEKYGIQLDRRKIISTVNDSSMHYDSIMEKIYIDYDAYFEEV